MLTNATDLIPCGVDADPDRNSDPFIEAEVNALARASGLRRERHHHRRRPDQLASQIAEFIQVRIAGLAHGFGEHEQPPRGCRNQGQGPEALAAVSDELPRIDELMAAARATR